MNYFEYFSEIEDRFTRRRGSALLLSTLDWALIETWREAGVPLAAVLRGIDDAFDKHDARAAKSRGRLRKVNGLAWCAQAVMQAAEELAEAAVGTAPASTVTARESGFEAERIAQFLRTNADAVAAAKMPAAAQEAQATLAGRLRELAVEARAGTVDLADLDRTLTVLEERLVAVLTGAVPETELLALREQADRELAPFRARMGAVQLRQVREQFITRRLLADHTLPRLSLFYMPVGE